MNNALFIISLQHEIAMAIGNKLDLKDMLKVFLKVCFSRLNLTSAHIYMYCDRNGLPIKLAKQQNAPHQHLLSIPQMKDRQASFVDLALSSFVKELDTLQHSHSRQCKNSHYLFGFIIPQQGLLIFETHYFIEETIQKALTPILQKLATSCYASIVHDSLVQEIRSRKIAEKKVIYQAQHDGLTGLINRQHLNDLLEKAITDSINNSHSGSIIFIDLNQFKPINDVMGHTIGDKILLSFAQKLQSLANDNIDVARFGGDEFILVIKKLSANHQQKIEQTIQKINNLLSTPIMFESNSYKLTCSIGYAIFPQQSSEVSNIIKFADIAMYEAKNAKTLQGIQYHTSMSDKINRRLAYSNAMKQSLVNDEFKLYYQAQYNHNADIVGAEALLRWQHPIYGMVSPSIYIPIAEESDLILNIGQWVLEQACRDIHQLKQEELLDNVGNIAVNISAKQLIQHDFQELIINTIEKNDIDPKYLTLELTESFLVENIDRSIKLLHNLKAKNIGCAIDDFGTGYSSLTYLQRIPANTLKIDRSFVTNIDKSKESIAIASMIISLGKMLNMKVLAEGVETSAELESLKSLGCYHYQGFYFSKPMPLPELMSLLDDKKQR
ncbi:bifunctional diguanylate cyclase/phosphodiesterase [uncultured Psychrosphaera sp.]|uniref:putative bifunctional diguanylate cyclase/phosphodiesterase n=1 Tax=uncultured Psychrosphaera sp. TaxID=1403522 RepID=UPI002621906F|nr:bifunctional diguanylate cyclase/phosphodiesterase [uncultured Psychrosphaera sp.]